MYSLEVMRRAGDDIGIIFRGDETIGSIKITDENEVQLWQQALNKMNELHKLTPQS